MVERERIGNDRRRRANDMQPGRRELRARSRHVEAVTDEKNALDAFRPEHGRRIHRIRTRIA